MPFPWKKNKVKRISQLVAGLQSPKRGGSLVVETGFPTSLIDLVVKNRERFEKTRTKKPVRVQVSDPVHQDTPPPPPPPPSPTTLVSLNENCLVVNTVDDQMVLTETESLRHRDGDNDFDGGVSVVDQNHVEESGSGTGPVSVVFAVLKMVMVLVFALSTKKLTVGISTSAFLLLFLEYVGRRFDCYLKPCSESKKWMISLEQMISNFFLLIKFVVPRKRTETCESDIIVSQFAGDSNSSISEIEVLEILEVVDTKVEEDVSFEKICSEGDVYKEDEIDFSNGDKVSDCLEIESERIVLEECEDCVSRNKLKLNAKFNSKLIKKLMPKKWRNTKKERKNREKETPESCSPGEINVGDDKSGKSGEHEEQEESGHRGQDHGTKLPFLEIGEDCDEKQSKENNGFSCCNGLQLQTTKEVDGNSRKQRNSGYAILFLIVLAGLLLGRVLALLLIMAWCVVLKFGERRMSLAKNRPSCDATAKIDIRTASLEYNLIFG